MDTSPLTDSLSPPSTLQVSQAIGSLPTPAAQAQLTPDPWSIDQVLSRAAQRLKRKFLPYIILQILLGMVMSIVSGIYLVIAVLLVAGLFVAGMPAAGVVLALVAVLGLVVMVTYLSTWYQLITTRVLIDDRPISTSDAIQSVRPLVTPALTVISLVMLFVLGLVPLGLVSFFLVPIIWSSLFGFTTFILLTTTMRGERVMWASVEMIKPNFVKVVVTQFAISLVINLALTFILGLFAGLVGGLGVSSVAMNGSKNVESSGQMLSLVQSSIQLLSQTLSYISNMIIAPFTICVAFEMYRLIPVPQSPKRPQGWVVVASIGCILVLALIMWGFVSLTMWALTYPGSGSGFDPGALTPMLEKLKQALQISS